MSVQILPDKYGEYACCVSMLPDVDAPPKAHEPDARAFMLAPEHVQIAVFVPLYTEEAYTLKRTLEHLTLLQEDMRKCYRAYIQHELSSGSSEAALADVHEPTLHILVVADGVEKVSQSMANYLTELFPGFTVDVFSKWGTGKPLTDNAVRVALKENDDPACATGKAVGLFSNAQAIANPDSPQTITYRIAPLNIDVSWSLHAEVRKEDRMLADDGDDPLRDDEGVRRKAVTRPLYVTLLVKQQNRKKHNSQRWFFDVFAKLCTRKCGTQYYFATDCGTVYSPHLLCDLLGHMYKNPNCGACCAHQRIMPYTDQASCNLGYVVPPEPWSLWALRCIQGADCDQGLCVFNGVHSQMGFLPVIPGPCGMFRASFLTEDTLEEVNDVCTNPPEHDGIIQGNLKLAEDRIISYLLILRAKGQAMATTDWVPDAVFYFEAEETLRELVLQRRRWLNGTVMGYPWLLKRSELWGSVMHTKGARAFQAVAVWLLCLVQLMVSLVVTMLPAFIGIVGHLTIRSVGIISNGLGKKLDETAMWTAIQMFWYLYGGSWLTLMFTARFCRTPYFQGLWLARAYINAIVIGANSLSMLTMFALTMIIPEEMARATGEFFYTAFQISFCAGLVYLSTPFVLAFMHSRDAFMSLAKTFYVYYAFLPTIVADFLTYSLSRLDDWSWGNKEGPAKAAVAPTVAVGAPPRARVEMTPAMRTTKLVAKIVPAVIVLVNCGVAGLVLSLVSRTDYGLLVIGGVFVAIGLTIMACTSVFFLGRSKKRPLVTILAYTVWLLSFAAIGGIITEMGNRKGIWYSRYLYGFAGCIALLWALPFIESILNTMGRLAGAATGMLQVKHSRKGHYMPAVQSLRPKLQFDGITVYFPDQDAPTSPVRWWMVAICVIALPISPTLLLIVFSYYILFHGWERLKNCGRNPHRAHVGKDADRAGSGHGAKLAYVGCQYEVPMSTSASRQTQVTKQPEKSILKSDAPRSQVTESKSTPMDAAVARTAGTALHAARSTRQLAPAGTASTSSRHDSQSTAIQSSASSHGPMHHQHFDTTQGSPYSNAAGGQSNVAIVTTIRKADRWVVQSIPSTSNEAAVPAFCSPHTQAYAVHQDDDVNVDVGKDAHTCAREVEAAAEAAVEADESNDTADTKGVERSRCQRVDLLSYESLVSLPSNTKTVPPQTNAPIVAGRQQQTAPKPSQPRRHSSIDAGGGQSAIVSPPANARPVMAAKSPPGTPIASRTDLWHRRQRHVLASPPRVSDSFALSPLSTSTSTLKFFPDSGATPENIASPTPPASASPPAYYSSKPPLPAKAKEVGRKGKT